MTENLDLHMNGYADIAVELLTLIAFKVRYFCPPDASVWVHEQYRRMY